MAVTAPGPSGHQIRKIAIPATVIASLVFHARLGQAAARDDEAVDASLVDKI
jgi:hypothetical protein